jgi:hypothetical protein
MDEALPNERKEVEPPSWARAVRCLEGLAGGKPWKSFNDAFRRDPSRQSWLLLVSESTNLHVRDDESAKLRLNNPRLPQSRYSTMGLIHAITLPATSQVVLHGVLEEHFDTCHCKQ